MIIELKVPVIGESVTEVTLSAWLKKDGEMVSLDEPICEFESDKATLEFPAEQAGILIHVAKEGDDLPIGGVVARIDTSASAATAPSQEKPAKETPAVLTAPTAEPTKETYATGVPSPAADKIIRENDLKNLVGTGKDGRVTKEDALNAVANKPETKPVAPPPQLIVPTVPTLQTATDIRPVRREKMSRMRRTIAKRLVSAKNNTAMLTTFNEVDMTGIMELRTKYQDLFVKKYGTKLGFMSIFAKACATVLLQMPEIGAQIDGDDVIFHDYADISIAVSTPTGLVVPVLKNVERMNFAQVEVAIAGLAKKARENKLTTEEMTGGTFTITNGGVFGSMMSTPIINEPQSAILGMHAIIERPIAVNGEIKIRPMMYLAMSYDHRLIDGSSSVTFLVKVKQLLEDPTKLLLDI